MGKVRRSGIYLLPNLFTTASLFAAFYSILASVKLQYEAAVVAIFIGMLADGLDGRIARLTNTQTEFGAEYDSLADMVTFGVAPALLVYSYSLHHLGKIGWLLAFIYTAAVALRLARFNTQVETADKRYFQGLACPSGAAVLASLVWLCYQHAVYGLFVAIVLGVVTVSTAVLMVSNVRYLSFKGLDFKGKVPFLYILFVVMFFAAIAVNPALVLFIGSLIYALSGPLQTLSRIKSLRAARRLAKKGK